MKEYQITEAQFKKIIFEIADQETLEDGTSVYSSEIGMAMDQRSQMRNNPDDSAINPSQKVRSRPSSGSIWPRQASGGKKPLVDEPQRNGALLTEEEHKSDLDDSLIMRKQVTETMAQNTPKAFLSNTVNESGDLMSTPLRKTKNDKADENTGQKEGAANADSPKDRSSKKVPPLDLKGAGL